MKYQVLFSLKSNEKVVMTAICIMAMLVFLYKMVFINSQYLLWRRSQKFENCAVSSSFGSY